MSVRRPPIKGYFSVAQIVGAGMSSDGVRPSGADGFGLRV
jgi:hypothetical protein